MNISKVITFIMVLSLVLSGCSAVKVPKSIDRAKKVVRSNVEQINAISKYHSLESPFTVTDTISIVIPDRRFSVTIPDRYNERIGDLLDEYTGLVFVETKDSVRVVEIQQEIIRESMTVSDTTYEDDYVVIDIINTDSGLKIDYVIKESRHEKEFTYDRNIIDTRVRWYEDRLFRVSIVIILLIVLFLVVYNKTSSKR